MNKKQKNKCLSRITPDHTVENIVTISSVTKKFKNSK